ncbi:MAG: T9SS type A sorting domain-containing protein [Chitinophagaceae bacterium]
MKRTILSTLMIAAIACSAHAQKAASYAITGSQKGGFNWAQVRQIDAATGQEIKTIYNGHEQTEILNARTGKPIVKKEQTNLLTFKKNLEGLQVLEIENALAKLPASDHLVTMKNKLEALQVSGVQLKENNVADNNDANAPREIRVNVNGEEKTVTVIRVNENVNTNATANVNTNVNVIVESVAPMVPIAPVERVKGVDAIRTIVHKQLFDIHYTQQMDQPFSTTSAACAYDKKHERLYYTPMGINQLRYIDLKAETPKIYYFEDEAFGVVTGRGDVSNQITRMAFGSDGNGYALTNNADHLIRFTTKKKSEISDLGPITDATANGSFSIRSSGAYGGDMIADDKGNLYLINAARQVFKIETSTKVATYKGTITGLPRGYSTNGAMVEGGTSVIIASANSTEGFFKFDINSLVAEKMPNDGSVFNASDLANGILLSAKKTKNDKEDPAVQKETPAFTDMSKLNLPVNENKVGIFPNPVLAGGTINILFADMAQGKYTIEFMEISGKVISSKVTTLSGKKQTEAYQLPELLAKGNYLVKVIGENEKVVSINKIVVQ